MHVRSARRFAARAAALLLLAAAPAACRDGTDPDGSAPTFTGVWAGRGWAGDASAVLLVNGAADDTLYIGASSPVNARSAPGELINITVAGFHGVGTYALGSDAVRFWELLGGDVITGSYGGAGAPAGSLEVTAYDGPGGYVQGKVSFVVQSTGPTAARGTGPVTFAGGRFRALVDRWPADGTTH